MDIEEVVLRLLSFKAACVCVPLGGNYFETQSKMFGFQLVSGAIS